MLKAVPDPDLEIRGGGGGGWRSPKKKRKGVGGAGPPGPLPGSATGLSDTIFQWKEYEWGLPFLTKTVYKRARGPGWTLAVERMTNT